VGFLWVVARNFLSNLGGYQSEKYLSSLDSEVSPQNSKGLNAATEILCARRERVKLYIRKNHPRAAQRS
jgi:hypothetical protein